MAVDWSERIADVPFLDVQGDRLQTDALDVEAADQLHEVSAVSTTCVEHDVTRRHVVMAVLNSESGPVGLRLTSSRSYTSQVVAP